MIQKYKLSEARYSRNLPAMLWEIPFCKNNATPVTYRHFLKNINSKNSLLLAPTDAYETQRLIKNLKTKSNSSPNDIPSFGMVSKIKNFQNFKK